MSCCGAQDSISSKRCRCSLLLRRQNRLSQVSCRKSGNWLFLGCSGNCTFLFYAPVAQLDRAFGFEPKGRRFESFRAHHLKIEPGTLDSRNGEISHKKLISARVASNWPPTSTRRKTLSSDGVQLAVVETGAPGGTRTPDPLVRSQMLYPAELQAQKTGNYWNILKITNKWNSGN